MNEKIKNIENLNLNELMKILKVYKETLFKENYKKTNTLKIKNENYNITIKINNDIYFKYISNKENLKNKEIFTIKCINENDLNILNENEKLLIKNFIIKYLYDNEFNNLIKHINNRKFLI